MTSLNIAPDRCSSELYGARPRSQVVAGEYDPSTKRWPLSARTRPLRPLPPRLPSVFKRAPLGGRPGATLGVKGAHAPPSRLSADEVESEPGFGHNMGV